MIRAIRKQATPKSKNKLSSMTTLSPVRKVCSVFCISLFGACLYYVM